MLHRLWNNQQASKVLIKQIKYTDDEVMKEAEDMEKDAEKTKNKAE